MMWGDPIGAASLNQQQSVVTDDTTTTTTKNNYNNNNSIIHPCAISLLQITGPGHIPISDRRWQEFFLHYDVLVHLDRGNNNNNRGGGGSVISQSCESMTKHGRTSSNLAALACHVARMLTDLETSCRMACGGSSSPNGSTIATDTVAGNAASRKIVLVGKARVTCGALNVFRILVHEVLLAACKPVGVAGGVGEDGEEMLAEFFSYRSRNRSAATTNGSDTPGGGAGQTTMDMSIDLISSILSFLSIVGGGSDGGGDGVVMDGSDDTQSVGGTTTNNNSAGNVPHLIQTTPELYDVTVQCLVLLTVLFSTQLYQPMSSSFHLKEKDEERKRQSSGDKSSETTATTTTSGHFFLDKVMGEACRNRQLQRQQQQQHRSSHHKRQGSDNSNFYDCNSSDSSSSTTINTNTTEGRTIAFTNNDQQQQKQQPYYNNNNINTAIPTHTPIRTNHRTTTQTNNNSIPPAWTPQSILASCLNWLVERPPPPPRSIAAHMVELANFVARDVKGEKVGPDGMYENYAIVMTRAPSARRSRQRRLESSSGGGGVSSSGGGRSSSLDDINALLPGGGSSSGEQPTSSTTYANTEIAYGSTDGRRSTPRLIIDATSKMIHISSSLLLLPFRLMTLALRVLGGNHHAFSGVQTLTNGGGYDMFKMAQLQAALGDSGGGGGGGGGGGNQVASRTNDVLWLTDSPVADLGCSVFLLLTNNYRATTTVTATCKDGGSSFNGNPFRSDLASLDDCRWESWNGLGGDGSGSAEHGSGGENRGNGYNDIVNGDDMRGGRNDGGDDRNDGTSLLPIQLYSKRSSRLLTTNFESLFEAFGSILHNEVGSLMLYTVLQSSPIFAASLAVRSDLELLVMPLLRTLYFSSSVTYHSGRTVTSAANNKNTETSAATSSNTTSGVDVLQKPFRSPSHLYVILILLLIFSQDTSFGPDSFRRSKIPTILWYRERQLKDISLGSVLVLSLLRCITFNLNRLQDPFLLTNCCAVLLNLSPHIVNLHPYAAMRLASVAVSSMKRYTVLVMKNGCKPAHEGDISSPLGMYAEVCRTLLQVLRYCIRRKVIEQNLHLVYALVYVQRDFYTVMKAKRSPFRLSDMNKIHKVISEADNLIRNESARTAEHAMNVLQKSTDVLKSSLSSSRNRRSSIDGSAASESTTMTGLEDFTFTYEEEADPEIFFVPYVWEVIVCAVTAISVEWNKDAIQVFPLLNYVDSEHEEDTNTTPPPESESAPLLGPEGYAKDVADVV